MLQRFIRLGAKGAAKRAAKLKFKAGFGWNKAHDVIPPYKARIHIGKKNVYGGTEYSGKVRVGAHAKKQILKGAKWVGSLSTVGFGTYLGTNAVDRQRRKRKKR